MVNKLHVNDWVSVAISLYDCMTLLPVSVYHIAVISIHYFDEPVSGCLNALTVICSGGEISIFQAGFLVKRRYIWGPLFLKSWQTYMQNLGLLGILKLKILGCSLFMHVYLLSGLCVVSGLPAPVQRSFFGTSICICSQACREAEVSLIVDLFNQLLWLL